MVSKFLTVVVLATSVLAHPNHKRHTRFHHGTGNGFAMPTGATFPMTNGTSHNGTDFGGSPIESPPAEATPDLPTATAVMTLTVSPVPLDTAKPDTGLSSIPNNVAIPSNTEVAAASSSPAAIQGGSQGGSPPGPPAGASVDSCSVLTSTVTSTSVQFVTVTATAGSDVAPTGAAGGFYGASSSEAATSSAMVAPSGGAGEFFPAPSSSTSGSLSINSPTAGEFFPHPGQQTSYAAGGASSSMTWASNGGAPSVVPTTFATIPSSAASMSSSSASSSPSTSPNTGGSTSGKKGLSYNTASLTNAFAGKGISWAYNWAAQPDGTIVSGAEFVPMFWGEQSVNGWASAAASAIASGSKHVLSLNEPDLAGQADVDPATAAKLHIDNMNPLAGQVQIGSPAITNGAGTSPLMGIDYLNAWFKACAGNCKVDFVAFHWYDSANNLAYFKSHVNDVIAAAQQNGVSKVWLTEYGATGSDSDVANFITEATAFLESTAAVERYAYFMCSDGILVNGNSISSPVGAAYA